MVKLSNWRGTDSHFAAIDNVRAALEWCFGDNGNVEVGVELAAAAAPVFSAMSFFPNAIAGPRERCSPSTTQHAVGRRQRISRPVSELRRCKPRDQASIPMPPS